MRPIDKLRSTYTSLAMVLLNTCILLLVFNFFVSVFFSVIDAGRASNRVIQEHGQIIFDAYPAIAEAEVTQLLNETWNRKPRYAPYVQYLEDSFAGEFVNVTETSFRSVKEQVTWPPPKEKIIVFVFGGSTTFGYGVADQETIPSFLQQHLKEQISENIAVYNFGQLAYFSTQERLLFEQLLIEDFRPDLAIFIDGLNDSGNADGVPFFTDQFTEFMSSSEQAGPQSSLLSEFALGRLISSLQNRLLRSSPTDTPTRPDDDSAQKLQAKTIISRYFNNTKIIREVADGWNVKTLFVWQPVPFFAFDGKNYPFRYGHWSGDIIQLGEATYEALDADRRAFTKNPNYLWLANIQEGMDFPLYVDRWHYSPAFSEIIAKRIVTAVREHRLLNQD